MRKISAMAIFMLLLPLAAFSQSRQSFFFKEEVKVKPQPQAKLVEIWIPLPREGKFQEVRNLTISSPLPFTINTESEYGNKFIYIRHEGHLNKPLQIKIEAQITRNEVAPQNYPYSIPIRYLLPDKMVPLKIFSGLSRQITKDKRDELSRLRAIYEYVVSHMKYDKTGKGWGRGDAVWACASKKGNCTDFHSLFIALARSAGIPAIFEIGLPIHRKGLVKGYHCWVLAFTEGKIYGIDASEAAKHPEKREYFFGHLSPDRIAITRGRDLLLSPAQHGGRINFLYKAYMEVDLQPSKGIETTYYVSPK
ncbi:MAG: transglutaminase domain-containing protein [Deferribacteres bacterium]|nr:transglutaminase domain-containing protein [Deferribacteres bacterium]